MGRLNAAIVGITILAISAPSSAQPNIPPIARASLDPEQATPGTAISFVGSTSIDPDDGPGPLTFEWAFGDSTTSTEADPSHTYAIAGVYPVTLTVRDGATQSLVSVTAHILDPPTPTPPVASSPLFLDTDREWLWAANPDSGSVTVVDLRTDRVLDEIVIGGRPTALAADDSSVFVVDRDGGRVLALDRGRFTVGAEIAVGHRPFAIARAPVTGDLLVSIEGDDQVVRLAGDLSAVMDRWDVTDSPRALAITHDGATLYVTHFITRGAAGTLTAIDLGSSAIETLALAEDPGPDTATSGVGIPNLLGAIQIEPAGNRVWIGGLKSNSSRGTFLTGEPFPFTNRLRAFFAPVDLAPLEDRVDRRIDPNDSDSVGAIVFEATGRWAFVSHPGSGRVSVYDMSAARLFDRGVSADTVGFDRVDVGHHPIGLALSADETRLYVLNELSRSLSVLDVSDRTAPIELMQITLTEEPLPPDVALGKRMFHRSRTPVHSRDNYIACASCHPDGGHDGRTWDFTQFGEGLRNTIDLRGRAGTGHGAIHWSANFNEVQDFENDIVHGFGGTGLAMDGELPNPPFAAPNGGRSAELDSLASYLEYLTEAPPSPFRTSDGTLTEAALRGRQIFNEAGCPTCHVRPRYTDSTITPDLTLHDVGTLLASSGTRLGETLSGLDTPSMLGLWDGAPYLHDGRATLRQVLLEENASDAHGDTSALSSSELDDLEAYLLQIDGRTETPPIVTPSDGGPATVDAGPGTPAGSGCACRATPGRSRGVVFFTVVVGWFLGLRLKRRR